MAILTAPLEQKASWRDYLTLCKPRVVALMILTSAIGMLLATDGWVPWQVMLLGNVGIALCAGSAAAINHFVDRQIDQKMNRTCGRPIADGRLSATQAVGFAMIIGLMGMTILSVFINALTAWLTLASLLGYALVYTVFLKRATPQNIVIGGIAGAAPPLLGWVAVTGSIEPGALLLVLIIFAWTPPHFWALAIARKEEYAKADIPMLPVTHGEQYTKLHIVLYTIILLAVSVLPFVIHQLSWIYLTGSVILGGIFLGFVVKLYRDPESKAAMPTFAYSITYLMLLFMVMLLDHYLL